MATIKKFADLAAWQRSYELEVLCAKLLADSRVRGDLTFHGQLSDASTSAPRNIAEGFGRGRPRENAQYVRVANGSANEVLTLFYEARDKKYIALDQFPRFETAAKRAIGTIVRYLKYLDSCDPDGPFKRRKRGPNS